MTAALAMAATVYGAAGALASILQLRRIRIRGSSRDVSLGYLDRHRGRARRLSAPEEAGEAGTPRRAAVAR